MTLSDLKNKKIAIVGMGVNNKHLAEYFRARRINFDIVEGWKRADDLIGRLEIYEIIFRTPGLPYLSKSIQHAKQKGVVIHSQTKLFFDLCPCPIIGVTGTKGKGTTATLISRLLEAETARQGRKTKIWLGGNIGNDPFEFIDKILPDDIVVLELSSFQLQDLGRSPHVAVVLKITPEHLDYHKSVEEYIDAKKSIVAYQTHSDFAVINYDLEVTRSFAAHTEGSLVWNSTTQKVKPGSFVQGEKIFLNDREIMPLSQVKLIGRFNLENVTAAIAAASCLGVRDPQVIRDSVASFQGLAHRLEFVREVGGVKFYNDSSSTSPEAAQAALSAFDDPVVLIVGGSEKKANYSGLATSIAQSKIKALIPIGKTGPKIVQLAREAGFEGRIASDDLRDMAKIVSAANKYAEAGDIVLLSPASASFDLFSDYKQRGELFKEFVNHLG